MLVAFDVITINEPPSLFPLPQLGSEKDDESKPVPQEKPLIPDEPKGFISSKMRKYGCTKISEQETKCEIVYDDKYEPITPSSNYSVSELKRYILFNKSG